jgi:hypothetical protein
MGVPASALQSASVRQATQPSGVQKLPIPALTHCESSTQGTQIPWSGPAEVMQ